MDVDAFAASRRADWDQLARLLRRRRHLSGEQAEQLVVLYQRAAADLSVVRSSSPDPALVARLSTLVARARAAVTGGGGYGVRQEVVRFVTRTLPASLYLSRWWWFGTAAGSLLLALLVGLWVQDPRVQSSLATDEEIRQLVEHDFADYYSSHPAGSFAAQVWTNNAQVAALSLATGILLGLPVLYLLATNAVNLGVSGGLMVDHERTAQFFGLILPHGLLELTAVFVAAGWGLRLGWTVIDPGRQSRSGALGQAGRSIGVVAIGLTGVLLVTGAIEAFVTPSGLPTWARVGIGLLAELAFLAYALLLGRAAVRAGATGDLGHELAAPSAPVAG